MSGVGARWGGGVGAVGAGRRSRSRGDKLAVRGFASDNGTVTRVLVNGREARALTPNFGQWEIELPLAETVAAHAEDAAGNVEKTPHVRNVIRP